MEKSGKEKLGTADETKASSLRAVKVSEVFEKLFESQPEINKKIREQMRPFVNFMENLNVGLRELDRRMRPVVLALAEIEKKIRPEVAAFVEALHRFEQFNIGLTERHKDEELMVPPFFAQLDLHEFVELFKDPDKPAFVVYNEFFSDQENIDSVLSVWKENRFFQDRMPIFYDAFLAHKEGKHTLSIPAFLAQIEGILCDIFEVRDHGKVKGRLKGMKFKKPDKSEAPFADAEAIAHIITEQIFLSTENDSKLPFPNRNRVLHGKNVFYYKDPQASLRCILLLDLLRSEQFLALNGKVESGIE